MMIVRLLIYLFESAFRNYMIDFFLLLMHVSSKAYWTLTPKIWNFCVWKTLLWEVNFFFVMMKMKFFVVEFKKQTWIFILFFCFVTMTNTPSNTNTNGFFRQMCFCASRQIKCLFHGHFCLFCLISMCVMTLSLWLHILVERYAACARNMNMRRTENDRFIFAGKLM